MASASNAQAVGEIASARFDLLQRVPGVTGILVYDEADGALVKQDGRSWLRSTPQAHANAFADLLARARKTLGSFSSDENLLHMSVRTRLQTEYLLVPDRSPTGLALLVVQKPSEPPAVPGSTSTARTHEVQTSYDWLFGAADE